MRVVIQRVSRASVTINETVKGAIEKGLLIFAGVGPDDNEEDARWLASKITAMRIFEDNDGKMNLSVKDVGGAILLISQFTLFASTKKGNRPSFNGSAPPGKAIALYETLHRELTENMGNEVPTGEFGSHMKINLCNDGPVTIIIDSKERR